MNTTRLWRLRRAAFLVRRSPPRLARPLSLALTAAPPQRPVLLIGCPRSGTTALRRALLASPELASVQAEGHILWNEFHPPRQRVATSDALDAGDVSERERRYVHLAVRLWTRGRRFLDKTPENCLRVAYLDALFPEATYVFLYRRAAENVSSLMQGWRARPRFVTHVLPEPLEGIAPLDGQRWSFALIPGWRDLRRAPLEVICARQYVTCNEAVLDAREDMDPARWVDVAYDDLLARPAEELRRVFGALGVAFTPTIEAAAVRLAGTPAPTSLTPPRRDKWRDENQEAVERVLPLLAETERRLGYSPATAEPRAGTTARAECLHTSVRVRR